MKPQALKILVVDDEKHIRQSFSHYLEDLGYGVLTAENGRIGLDLLADQDPDLVLLDLLMPEVDGIQVLEQGKALVPDTPFIVISGANRITDVVRALRFGAWDYLEKPVRDMSILGHSVEKALEKARLKKENQAYQKHLEEMVRARTRELETANARLSRSNTRLRKSEHKYRTLFEKTNDAIFMVETATGSLLDANRAAGVLTGRSIAELKQLTIRDLGSHGTGEVILSADGPSDLGTVRYIRPDKTCRIARVSSFPLDDMAVIGIARDITQDLELEKQLRRSSKMEAIGTLAGGIAHDFNNILSGIFGYAQLAEMNLGRPDKARSNIEQVVKGAGRAGELIQQILTFSRQVEHERMVLRLYIIVKEAVKFLRSSIPSSIEIIEQINSRSLVLADATQIHQVVMNLCTNAYHAMGEEGGTLTVSLSDTELGEEAVKRHCSPGPYTVLGVEDTGMGIDADILDRIFDPYFTTKAVSQGTGLGLAVVDGIVKKHQGFITVSAKAGEGALFQVFLPVADPSAVPISRTSARDEAATGTGRLLLVEDDAAVLKPTQRILEKLGYQVTPCTDGASALAAFAADPQGFDLVITDLTMPRMSGKELSRRILALRKDIPVIMCTGFHETFTREAALQMGIRRYLQKPVTGKELAWAVREELAGGAPQ